MITLQITARYGPGWMLHVTARWGTAGPGGFTPDPGTPPVYRFARLKPSRGLKPPDLARGLCSDLVRACRDAGGTIHTSVDSLTKSMPY